MAGFQREPIPLAGCKGGTLRWTDRTGENYPVDDFRLYVSGSRLRCAEVRQTLLGDPRGQSPLASLAKAEKPKGFFGAAVRCGLPQCETCLITHRRFRSLGGRRRVICGFAICQGGRCLMPGREYEYRFRQEVIFCSMIWQKEKGHNSPVA